MTTLALLAAAEETHRELPFPSWLVGVLALLAFAFALGVTWSFRGTANKYAPPAPRTSPDQATTPDATRDESHWPEHPGHH